MKGLLQRRCFRRDADGVEKGHAAGGGRRCAQRLQLVFAGVGAEALDDGDLVAAAGADEIAQHGIEDVFAEQSWRQIDQPVENLAPAVF